MMHIWLHFPWGLAGSGLDLPAGGIELLLPEGTSVRRLLETQDIPLKAVGLISANGSLTKADHTLRDRDDIRLYPPLEGG